MTPCILVDRHQAFGRIRVGIVGASGTLVYVPKYTAWRSRKQQYLLFSPWVLLYGCYTTPIFLGWLELEEYFSWKPTLFSPFNSFLNTEELYPWQFSVQAVYFKFECTVSYVIPSLRIRAFFYYFFPHTISQNSVSWI